MAPVPVPAHPHRRREPLPWQAPKPAQDDPEAPRCVRAICEDPAYREADRDVDFLQEDATRGLRLQLDCAKPQQQLERHGIRHTTVVLGGTRIVEPADAHRRADRLRARALVAFPGGYGTLDELFETLTLVQTRKIRPLPIVLVGEDYWRRAVDLDFLVAEGTIDAEDRELFWYAETAQDAWDGILHWYAQAGEPVFPASAAEAST